MSVLFDADNDQLKVTLASALTIGTGYWITTAWVRLTSSTPTSLLWALVDVDPNATVSRRVWVDTGGTDITADEDGGGLSPYTASTGTWYFIVYSRFDNGGTATTRIRIFDDSSSTTPLHDNQAGDATNLTTFDTIIIGDIEPSARVACRMEVISLKVQTGVSAGLTDSECRTESQFFAIQKAGGTDRFAWELEDLDADSHGLNERGGSGNNFANSGGTVTVGSNRPTQLEAAGGGGGSFALDDSDGGQLITIQQPLTAVRLY